MVNSGAAAGMHLHGFFNVQMSVCVCVCVRMCGAPKAINNYWHDFDFK